MNLISIMKELWARRVLVAVAALAAAAIAMLVVFQVSLSPPGLAKRSEAEARGSIAILVDSTRSSIADAQRDLTPLAGRASVFASFMAGGNVIGRIAEANDIPVRQIDVTGPLPLPGQAPGIDGQTEQRNPYGITITQQADLPILAIETRAPTIPEARGLAAAAPAAIREVVRAVQAQQGTPVKRRVQFRVLGPAETGIVNEARGARMAVLLALFLLAIFLFAILGVPRFLVAWRGGKAVEQPLGRQEGDPLKGEHSPSSAVLPLHGGRDDGSQDQPQQAESDDDVDSELRWGLRRP